MTFIPEGIFDQYYEFVDELYTNNHISDKVKLFYLSKENCPNCIPGYPNKYNNVGSTPFSFGPCPVCNGQNYIQSTTEEEVKLRVYNVSLRKKENINAGNTNFPNGEIQIIGKMENLSKITKADYFNIFSNTQYDDFRYYLSSSPIPYGFGSSQFICYAARK
jgi:excinuclease UvrABC ATPase subunit